jgi:uncharacterized protein (DUF305 family)
MCEKAKATGPDISKLCQEIVSSQQAEISLMKSLMRTER